VGGEGQNSSGQRDCAGAENRLKKGEGRLIKERYNRDYLSKIRRGGTVSQSPRLQGRGPAL